MSGTMTVDILRSFSPEEFEGWRSAGEDMRRELTPATMHNLVPPDGWYITGEYHSEYGGSFPVYIRFTPLHGAFYLAVCSPGALSSEWKVILSSFCGGEFSVVCSLPFFLPEIINHTLGLIARLDESKHSAARIISMLAMEGTIVAKKTERPVRGSADSR